MTDNTTQEQDRQIDKAREGLDVSNLIDIIEDLDKKLTAWTDAANNASCDTPEQLESFIVKAQNPELGI